MTIGAGTGVGPFPIGYFAQRHPQPQDDNSMNPPATPHPAPRQAEGTTNSRVDVFLADHRRAHPNWSDRDDLDAMTDFARILERELAEATKEAALWERDWAAIHNHADRLQAQLATLTAERDSLQRFYDLNIESWKKLQAERDRLQGELGEAAKKHASLSAQYLSLHDEWIEMNARIAALTSENARLRGARGM